MRHTPCIVSIDGTQDQLALTLDDPLLRRDYRAGARRDRRVYQRAAAVVATSQWAADDLLRQLPALAPRVRVLPYPVALEGFDPGWIEERRARAAGAPVRVLFMGGSFRLKGGQQLLEAWGREGMADAATLTLVSDSAEVSESALPPGVALRRGVRAYTPEWLELWRQADLFVLPTRMDAFGMVLQEAAAAGLPVIANRFNATPELVVQGETGVLVPPGDSAALGRALRELVASAELRQRMGSAGRRRIEERASLRGYGEALGALIREVAGRG
jgi:glycosyltransferase involved in cell wall biosynthesis